MKIELSPWAVSDTSVQFPRKRRRSRSKDDSPPSSSAAIEKCQIPVVAAFAEDAANERVPKPGKWESVLSLTFQNEVRVLGRTLFNGDPVIQESERMTQVARPSTTFLKRDDDPSLPWIPCLHQAGRFFALQDGNKRLVSWTTDQTVEEGCNATLPSPALTLTKDGKFVLGACQDGSFFVARASPELPLDIEFHYPCIPANAAHLATFFDPSRTRREVTEAKPRSIIQIYSDGRCLLIHRHVLTSGGIVSKCVQCVYERAARDVQFVGLHGGNVILRYSVEARTYCCSVSTSEAAVTTRVALPPCFNDSRRNGFGLVGSVMVLAPRQTSNGGSVKQLYVCDVYRENITSVIPVDVEYDQLLSLHTDGGDRVALVVARNDKVCVALATLRWCTGEAEVSCHSSLAKGLFDRVGSVLRHRGDSSSSGLCSEFNDSVSHAVDLLNEALTELRRTAPKTQKKHLLPDAYERAMSLFSGVGRNSKNAATDAESATNPQEPYELQLPLNGKKRKSPSQAPSSPRTETMNGVRLTTSLEITLEPKMLPEAFVRSACQITVEILLLSHLTEETRNDARVLLRRFVRSGKVSARLVSAHLSDLFHGLESQSSLGKTAYSPVDFIFDMLRCCKDVSEHQAVECIKYLLCCATTRDICSHLRRDKWHRQLDVSCISILHDRDDIDESRIQSEQERILLKQESLKVVLLVVFSCVRLLASYSECNEILLKNAIRTLLSPGDLFLLRRLLTKLLSSKMLGTAEYLVILQWLAVVNEQGYLLPHKEDHNLTDAIHVQKTTRFHVRSAEGLISLKQLVASSVDAAKKVKQGANSASSPKKDSNATQSYQIERLVL